MNITAYPSPNRAGIQRCLGDVRAVIIHDLEAPTASGLATLTTPGGNSVHYVIAEDGRTYELVPEWDVAYHVAAWGNNPALNRNRPAWLPPYNGCYSAVNAATVGIELAGWAATGFTAAQYTALGQLVAGICEGWRLEPRCLPEWGAAATITSHAWLQTDRSDPGARFDWAAFQAALDAANGISTIPVSEEDEMAALSESDRAILELCHSLHKDAAGITADVELIGALSAVVQQRDADLADAQAKLLAALTAQAGRDVTRVTITFGDGTTQEVGS